MRTFIFYSLTLFLFIFSGYLSINSPGSVSNASSEIITFISILSAAVMSCIFSVSKHIAIANFEEDKKALFFVNNYWVRFFFVCSVCAAATIIGEIIDWPIFTIPGFDLYFVHTMTITFDALGFIALSSLALIITMLFIDFPRGIRDLMLLEDKLKPESKEKIEIATLDLDPDHGKIKK